MKKVAYVIIHGFGGNPKDVEIIKKELIDFGVPKDDIFLPLIYGHYMQKRGIDIEAKYTDMVIGMRNYVQNISENYNAIIIIGYSMGALLALQVAVKLSISKLILLNPPLHIWNGKNFVRTIKDNQGLGNKFHIKTLLSSFSYRKILNKLEMTKLQKNTIKKLRLVNADTLIIKSKCDYVAKPESSDEVYEKIQSKVKKIIEYDKISHFIPKENCVGIIVKEIFEWIQLEY